MKTFISKFTLLLAAFATLALQSCKKEEAPDRELVLAGDIENAALVRSHWWKHNEGNTPLLLEVSSETSYSPSHALKISVQDTDETTWGFWAQTIYSNIPTGKEITLKVKVKGNLVGQGVSIAVRGNDSEGNLEQFVSSQNTTPITGTFDWQEHSVTLGKVGKNTKRLIVYLIYLPQTTGEVYFDNISLTY